jgi:hypothetical protein
VDEVVGKADNNVYPTAPMPRSPPIGLLLPPMSLLLPSY